MMRQYRFYRDDFLFIDVMVCPAPKPKNRVLYEWRGWGYGFKVVLKNPKTRQEIKSMTIEMGYSKKKKVKANGKRKTSEEKSIRHPERPN